MQGTRLVLAIAWLASNGVVLADPKREYPVAKESYPFQIKVHDFYGAEGFGFDYYLASDRLTVVYWDDFGSKPKQVFDRVFSADERKRWSAFLAKFPVAALESAYVNPGVDDGLQMRFDFRLPGKPSKSVVLQNRPQKDLELLCAELNKWLPNELKAHGPRGAVWPSK